MDDPRSSLAPGTYNATVTKVGEFSIEYSIPECGEWRYAIDRKRVTVEFWDHAVNQGWFEIKIDPMIIPGPPPLPDDPMRRPVLWPKW